jgi:hypothetical protein
MEKMSLRGIRIEEPCKMFTQCSSSEREREVVVFHIQSATKEQKTEVLIKVVLETLAGLKGTIGAKW